MSHARFSSNKKILDAFTKKVIDVKIAVLDE